jgi:hypothetical protein
MRTLKGELRRDRPTEGTARGSEGESRDGGDLETRI